MQDQQQPAPFSRQPKEVWRWYAWTRMRPTEPMRWIATCWKGDTEEEAGKKREQALMEDETLILVCERTTFQSDSTAPGWQPIKTLSEPDQDVLLWGMLDCETRPGCHKGCLKRTGYGHTWFESVTSPDGCNHDEIASVTHWMPLPCEPND
jgi:hypothetical protein